MDLKDNLTTVIRHVAGPGCGKTTKLLEFLKEEQNKGLELNNLHMCSFTRAQVSDLKRRVCGIYPEGLETNGHGKPVIDSYIKTFHGLALLACVQHGLITPSRPKFDGTHTIISQGKDNFGRDWRKPVYLRFCVEHGLAYDPNVEDPLEADGEISGKQLPIGNQFFAIYSLLRSRLMPLEHWATARMMLGADCDQFKLNPDLFHAWEEFKKRYSYLEHEDYVILAADLQATIAPMVLMVDEFQDLSPAQYQLYELWRDSGLIERIYIAGDPDQSIYSFRGAHPGLLRDTAAVDHTGAYSGNLPISYRCPSSIVRLSERILGRQSNMAPKTDGGVVSILDPDERVIDSRTGDISPIVWDTLQQYGEVLILCRFRTHVKTVSNHLSLSGIPHVAISGKLYTWYSVKSRNWVSVKADDILTFLHATDDYFKGDPLAAVSVAGLKEIVPVFPQVTHDHPVMKKLAGKRGRDQILIADIVHQIPVLSTRLSSAAEVADLMAFGGYQDAIIRAAYRNYISRGVRIHPGQVRIDTIHQSKGLESKAVIILGAFQKDKLEMCHVIPGRMEEEQRIYFVAATRASEYLCILKKPLFKGVLAPPLGDL